MPDLNNSDDKVRILTLSGLFAALIYILTAYLHIPTGMGYTHAGDGLIYLAACILPAPYAAASAAIGGALADGLTGFAVWMPATIIIKALTALFFTNKGDKILSARNILGIIPSMILCIAGYSLYQGTIITVFSEKGQITKSALTAAFAQAPSYCIQVLASTILFVIIGLMLDRMKFKTKFSVKS